jgi:hypothetical protein
MRSPIPIFLCLLALTAISCKSKVAPRTTEVSEWIVKPPDFKVGDMDKNGRLIFWQIDAHDHMEPFILQDEYGVILANNGEVESPTPRYILACNSTKRIVDTNDFKVFLTEVNQIPRNSTIGRYDTCSIPRAYGLSNDVCHGFVKALTDRGLIIETECRGVCYCPNRN